MDGVAASVACQGFFKRVSWLPCIYARQQSSVGNQSSAVTGQASMLFDRPVVETGTTGVSVQWGTLPGGDSERTVTPLV